jgi:hypothetical protein
MDPFLTTLSDFFRFLQEHFFPALVFMLLNEFVLLPTLSQKRLISDPLPPEWLSRLGIAFVVAVILGYALKSLNTHITQLFQGYPLYGKWYGEWLTRVQEDRQRKLRRRISTLEKRIAQLKEDAAQYELGDSQRELLYRQRKALEEKLEEDRPLIEQKMRDFFPTVGPFRPTQFGNLIEAFHDYSFVQYGIDARVLWRRIEPVLIQEGYDAVIKGEKAKVDFFIDLSLLSAIFSIEWLMSIIVSSSGARAYESLSLLGILIAFLFALWLVGSKTSEWLFSLGTAASLMFAVWWSATQKSPEALYLLGTLLAIVFAIWFYHLAVAGAYDWGETVKSAFDLYRYQLLKTLYGHSPRDFAHERELWEGISSFLEKGIGPKNGGLREKHMFEILHYSRIQEDVGSQTLMPQNSGKRSKVWQLATRYVVGTLVELYKLLWPYTRRAK